MMKAVVSSSQAALLALAAKLDAALGYPKAGLDFGDGIHAPPGQTVTLTYTFVFKHPTLASYALFHDPAVGAMLAFVVASAQARIVAAAPQPFDAALVALPPAATLTPDWTPAPAMP